ncbi:MAG: SgcJ/EcaC family oxidoreductase [Acidobacteriales bacterium]|nr:SgcJ/EcaC family oxidoreductase [Terriglobales bacterium]
MHSASSAIAVILLSVLTANRAVAQLMSTCVENSPERRGKVGCSIIENKLLPVDLKQPLFWHIERFESAERARTAVGPQSVAFEAAGAFWLMTIESQSADHHGGSHVAQVGPLPLPPAQRYSMQALSAAFPPGMYSLVHHHSGVEAVYVIEGEGCYETPTRGFGLRKGETVAIPADTPMRAVATGSARRYVLAVIVHDAAQPPTMRMEEGTGPQLVGCSSAITGQNAPSAYRGADREQDGATGNPDEAAIRRILQDEVEAWNKGDVEAYSRHVAADVTFTNVRGMFFTGYQAFLDRRKEIFKGMFRGTTLRQEVVSLRFLRPDVAVVETLTWISGFSAGPPPGTQTDEKGRLRTRLLQLMVKDAEEWKIAVYHNVDIKPGVTAPEPQ